MADQAPSVTNTVIVNNYVNGKKQRNASRRKKLRKKLDAPPVPLPVAPSEHREQLPKDVDLNDAVHHSSLCIATSYINARWSHEPTVRLLHRVKQNHNWPKRSPFYADDVCTYDRMVFNDEAYRRFGLTDGCKIAVFTEKLGDKAKYIFFQIVNRRYECPAHVHKLGQFELTPVHKNHVANVRADAKPTELGYIGFNGYRSLGHGMVFFRHFPQFSDHLIGIKQVEGHPDLLIGHLTAAEPLPDRNDLLAKMTRRGPLVESDSYKVPSARFSVSAPACLYN